MGELKIIIYIIIGVVWLLSRLAKKKPQDSSLPQERPSTDSGNPQKAISFEDLLKEIQASKSPEQKPVIQKTTSYKEVEEDIVDYDDEVEEEVVVAEKKRYRDPEPSKTFDIYEKAKQAAFNRPSLEETMKVEDTVVKFGQFKDYQQDTEVNVLAEYVKDLQSPDSFKKAFILSEVLNRKF
jgi:xanthine dehydrogenase molybdopterin-binding subunit B